MQQRRLTGNQLAAAAPASAAAPAAAFGKRDGGSDAVDSDHAEMFAIRIDRRQGFELRVEVA